MSEVSILPGRERRRKWRDGEKLSIVEDDVSANSVFGLAVETLSSAAHTFNRVVQVWLMAWFITSAVSIVMAIVTVCDAHDRSAATRQLRQCATNTVCRSCRCRKGARLQIASNQTGVIHRHLAGYGKSAFRAGTRSTHRPCTIGSRFKVSMSASSRPIESSLHRPCALERLRGTCASFGWPCCTPSGELRHR
jgi:hypothetical protein